MAGFVTDTVEDELAYSMESLGMAPDVMRRRVEETLDLLGLADGRDPARPSLSGGQRQRASIRAPLTPHPAAAHLGEATAGLGPAAAADCHRGRAPLSPGGPRPGRADVGTGPAGG